MLCRYLFVRSHLMCLQAFQIVEKAAFRALLRFQRPQMKDSQMVHKTKLREWILIKAQDLEGRLRKYFKVCISIYSAVQPQYCGQLMCNTLEHPWPNITHLRCLDVQGDGSISCRHRPLHRLTKAAAERMETGVACYWLCWVHWAPHGR